MSDSSVFGKHGEDGTTSIALAYEDNLIFMLSDMTKLDSDIETSSTSFDVTVEPFNLYLRVHVTFQGG